MKLFSSSQSSLQLRGLFEQARKFGSSFRLWRAAARKARDEKKPSWADAKSTCSFGSETFKPWPFLECQKSFKFFLKLSFQTVYLIRLPSLSPPPPIFEASVHYNEIQFGWAAILPLDGARWINNYKLRKKAKSPNSNKAKIRQFQQNFFPSYFISNWIIWLIWLRRDGKETFI